MQIELSFLTIPKVEEGAHNLEGLWCGHNQTKQILIFIYNFFIMWDQMKTTLCRLVLYIPKFWRSQIELSLVEFSSSRFQKFPSKFVLNFIFKVEHIRYELVFKTHGIWDLMIMSFQSFVQTSDEKFYCDALVLEFLYVRRVLLWSLLKGLFWGLLLFCFRFQKWDLQTSIKTNKVLNLGFDDYGIFRVLFNHMICYV